LNHVWPIWRDRTLTGRERERRGLIWDVEVMPARLLWEGRLLIALGLLPTAVTLLGLGAVWRRVPATAGVVLMVSAALGIGTPVFQTVRQPFRSSMKVTFALSALLALVVFFVAGYAWLTNRRYGNLLRAIVLANLVLLAAVVAWHFVDLALLFPGLPLYFARRDPL
jgi:cation transport ATPase